MALKDTPKQQLTYYNPPLLHVFLETLHSNTSKMHVILRLGERIQVAIPGRGSSLYSQIKGKKTEYQMVQHLPVRVQ